MTPPRARAAIARAAAIMLASAPAASAPVDTTATTTGGWHTDTDYGELFGRLNASTGAGPWQLALRVDTATFFADAAPPLDRYALEKASAGYTDRSLEVTVGDAYVSFGRGLVLSLRKLDELGVDTTVRGAKMLVHAGDFSATLVAGDANINNVDEATGTIIEDPYDLIAGAQAQVRVADRLHVGTHGSIVAFHDSLGLVEHDRYTDRATQVGVNLDAPRLTPNVGFYLEGVGQVVRAEPEPEEPTGFGLYGSATGYLGRGTLLIEGKAYGNLTPLKPDLGAAEFATVAYHSPPTVERVLQPIENPQREIAGGRTRFDWPLSPAWVVFANYGLFRDWQGYTDPESVGDIRPGTIHDPYAGLETRWNDGRSWAIVAGGHRRVVVDASGLVVRGDGHAALDLSQALNERWSLTLHGLHLERRKHSSPLLDEAFREGTVDAGFRVRPWIAVSGGYDYTTEPIQRRRDYFHGNLAWDLTPSSSLRLFAGAARGGLKCVSGTCRLFPPFEGVKVTATVRF
ncbi:MAG: hypothetical protein AABZ30_15390 [Myxococcota bacterium]